MSAGIYPTRAGFRVVACIGRGPDKRREHAFPAGTATRAMVRWQEEARRDLREAAARIRPGSLLADLEQVYLPAVQAMPTLATRARHLRMWLAELGAQRHRDTVTAAELRAILERWHLAGWTRATCNRARTALMHFYSVLNGKSGVNVVRDVPRARERQAPPKPFSYPLFEALLSLIPDTWPGYGRRPDPRLLRQTKARLRVMAYVGLPQMQIRRLLPAHLLAADRMVYILGRRKGEGTDDVYLPVGARGLAALQELFACQAHGAFHNSTLRTLFQAGALRVGRPDLTPYDLRHLFGTTILRVSTNRAATRDLMIHSDDATTTRYVRAAIPVELRAALDAFDAAVVESGCGPTPSPAAETPVTH